MVVLVTPTRICQSLSIPDLDAKPQVDDLTTTLTYGGLHTPPSSASQSHRPSVQCPWHEAPCSSPPTAHLHYSQPTTPVHRIPGEHNDFKQDWFENDFAPPTSAWRSNGTSRLDHRHGIGSLLNAHMSEPTPPYGGPLALGMDCPSEFMSVTTPWNHASDPTRLLAATQTAFLGPELFPTSQPLVLCADEPDMSHEPIESTMQDFPQGVGINHAPSQQNRGLAMGNSPPRSQVVVPSQLGSQDVYYPSHVVDYGSPEHSSESCFGSSLHSSYASFDALEAPSPMDTGIDPAEDDDYLLLDGEEIAHEPKRHVPMTRGAARLARKRYAKRACGSSRGPWYRHEVGGIEVQCEGKEFPLDGSHNYDTVKPGKKYVCTFMEQGKHCGTQFDRSEHLKRHFGSHTNERPYFCPLPTCAARIERPDNACDHFKSHLKPEKPGRRNRHVEWPELHMAILEKYEDKKRADKLIENLQRWVEMGMPNKTSERQQLADARLAMESGRGQSSRSMRL